MRTPAEALAAARLWTTCGVGKCLWTVQEWYQAPHEFPSAIAQWEGAREKHAGDRNPPVGVPVYYSGGKSGHIALSTGHGIRSTDALTPGHVAEVDLDWPLREWGHQYVGWSADLGGLAIPGIQPAPPNGHGGKPVLLSKLHYGQTDSDSVRMLQQALNGHHLAPPGNITLPITGDYGPKTDQVVIACQVQHGFGHDAVGHSDVGPEQAVHLGLTVQ